MAQDSGTGKGMEKEMDVPDGAWCKFLILSLGSQFSLGSEGAGSARALQSCVLPDSHTLLQFRQNHHEMGMPREGFCRGLADSVVPDH